MDIFLDIETLPTADPDVIADIASTISHPGNISKPESIAAWEAEKKPAVVNDAVKRTSFDGLYGRIACAAWALDDLAICHTAPDDSERAAIIDLFGHLSRVTQKYHGDVRFIGHNVHGFDLPFLKHRAIIHGIKPPHALMRAMSAKPWDGIVQDTMLMWSTDREKRVSLDKLCKAFGIPGKDGFDGSMVAETWPADPGKVIAYCCDDVQRVRSVYRRMTFADVAQFQEAA